MPNKFGTDMTAGSIPKHLVRFSLPMFAGNIIQIGYSIVNTIWVGHLVGENAVGAAGVSFPVLMVLFGVAMGMAMATTILVSQYYGAKDYDRVERTVGNSFALSIIIGVVLSIVSIIFSDAILRIMKTPPENFAMASIYLKLSLAGFILFYLTFLINSILRGIGDTVTPLMFMAVGLGLNTILDPFFIGGFGPFPLFGLKGAAVATMVSQAVTLVTATIYLNRKSHLIAFNLKKLTLNGELTRLLFKIGFPSIIQQSLLSIAVVFISTFVNHFGAAATNAFGAAVRVDMFAIMPALSVSMAVAASTGQSLGAGRQERIKGIFRWGFALTACVTIAVSLVVFIFAGPILRMFGLGQDPRAMQIGISYMRIVGPCYFFLATMFIANGVVNGAGHTIVTMIFSLVSLWLVRVPGAWLLSKTSLGINGIWITVGASFVVTWIVSIVYYYSGRWKKSVIIKRPEAMVVPPIME